MSVLSALMIAVEEVFVLLSTSSLTELPLLSVLIPLFGILLNMLDACAILDSVDLIAHYRNVLLEVMFCWDLVTLREETAPEEESVITRKDFASVSLVISEPDANSRLSSVKQVSFLGVGCVCGGWMEGQTFSLLNMF